MYIYSRSSADMYMNRPTKLNQPIETFYFCYQSNSFKIAVLAFNCVLDTGPAHFNDVYTSLVDIPGRSGLLADDCGDILEPATKTRLVVEVFPLQHLPSRTYYLFICMIKLSANAMFQSGWKTH